VPGNKNMIYQKVKSVKSPATITMCKGKTNQPERYEKDRIGQAKPVKSPPRQQKPNE
jgi:hypothetical protein